MRDVIAVVAATAETRGIGYNGDLVSLEQCIHDVPTYVTGTCIMWTGTGQISNIQFLITSLPTQPWRLPADMAHFKRVTCGQPGTNNAVIMGRKTWDSIPPKFRPLPSRTNVVLTRSTNTDYPDNVLVASSLKNALDQLSEDVDQVFVIGGAQVYQESIESGLVNRVIYTKVSNVDDESNFDAFFPTLDKSKWECQTYGEADKENGGPAPGPEIDAKSGLNYEFLDYTLIPEGPEVNPEEMQYLKMCREIIEEGVSRTLHGRIDNCEAKTHLFFNNRPNVVIAPVQALSQNSGLKCTSRCAMAPSHCSPLSGPFGAELRKNSCGSFLAIPTETI